MMRRAYKSRIHAARAFARSRGMKGKPGGWIYNSSGLPVCHGWQTWANFCESRGLIRPVGGMPRCTCPRLPLIEAIRALINPSARVECKHLIAKRGPYEIKSV